MAFLKRDVSAIGRNPQTVARIADTLHNLGFDALIEGIEEPKEFNRQIGTLFGKFPPKLGYPLLGGSEFESFTHGIAIMDGSDEELKKFARRKLEYSIEKGLDLIAKVNQRYIIGEAKFLTDYGGHQNAQFEDALRLLRDYKGLALAVAILDGVLWIRGNTKMFKTVKHQESNILSALLVKDFLESFG